MKRSKEIFLLGMLAVSLCMTSGCTEETKREGKAEQEGSSATVRQMSNVVSNVSDDGKLGRSDRAFEDSIANYFEKLPFLTEEEKARLLQEEKEFAPMVERLKTLDEEIMKVHEDYYFQYAPVLAEYTWAEMRRIQAWNKYSSLDSEAKNDSDIRQGIERSEGFTKEEKEQLKKDEETLKRLEPEKEKIENAIEFETSRAEREKRTLAEKMREIHRKNQEIWDKIRERYGSDLAYYPDDIGEMPFDIYTKKEPLTPNRKMERLSGVWREEDLYLRSMRDLTESIENYFPQLTFLKEEEKKALVAEETEWKNLLAEMERLQSEIVKIYDEDKAGREDLYEKYEAAQRAHFDLRWKMHNAAPENRELSDEEQIRKSTVLTEEEKELLLKDEAVIRELKPEISKIQEKIADKVNLLERKREVLSEKIVAVHEKNRAIWDKILDKGLRLEISTSYLPPIDSEQWFQKK